MFQLADVEYEDKRVTQDEWKVMKPNTGLGKLPVLEVDGKELPQSGAICRFVAREHGFYPPDAWGRAQVDVITETIVENDASLKKVLLERDQEKKEVLKKEYVEGSLKRQSENLEKLLRKNNEGVGWFVGDKITLADVMVFCIYYDINSSILGKDPSGLPNLDGFELLKSFIVRFKSEPKIAEWIEKRPMTPF